MKKALKIILDVLAWILLIVAMLVTLLVFTSSKNDGISSIFGFMPMSVQSDSMSPTFKQGDMIMVKKIDDVMSLKEDDVITFYTIVDGARIINTHRIVKIEETDGIRSFITRGDNNPIDDTLPVYSADIIGKWTGTSIGSLGKFMDFLKTKTGFFVCVLIPVALFFIFELYKLIAAIIEARREKDPKLDEEEIKRKAVEEYLAAQKEKEAAEKAAAEATGKAEDAATDAEKAVDAAVETAADAADAAGDAAAEAEKTADAAADTVNKENQ